jgi:membrane-bound serine protease (ClpP class)
MALLFAAGMALILAEFFLPGIVMGVIGVAFLITCAVMGFMYYPDYALMIILAEFFGVSICVALGMYIMSTTNVGKSLRLEKSQSLAEGYVSQASDLSLVGKCGTAMTVLRPAGTIIIEGKRVDAVSNGSMIDQGSEIRVIEVHGGRVVVEKVT